MNNLNLTQGINDSLEKQQADFDLVDQLTQNLINAFENKEIIPSYKDENEKMFGKFVAESQLIQYEKNYWFIYR